MRRTAFVVLFACAALTPSGLAAQRNADRDRDRITREQLQDARAGQTLHQVIERLRPHFLQPARRAAGATADAPVVVYVNARRESGVDALRRIDAGMVEEVRYLDPSTSFNEFGADGANGALVVKLRRRPAPPGDGQAANDRTERRFGK